ncbi:hypothetical protein G6F24_015340 [Rhizopus arrhizus]|nr:hypothetical protein G6F24_015340 [Rhizopus arrhizus]
MRCPSAAGHAPAPGGAVSVVLTADGRSLPSVPSWLGPPPFRGGWPDAAVCSAVRCSAALLAFIAPGLRELEGAVVVVATAGGVAMRRRLAAGRGRFLRRLAGGKGQRQGQREQQQRGLAGHGVSPESV